MFTPDRSDNGWTDDPDWEFRSSGGDAPDALYARYDSAVSGSRRRFAAAVARGGPDQEVALHDGAGHHASLRRLLHDIVEEHSPPDWEPPWVTDPA